MSENLRLGSLFSGCLCGGLDMAANSVFGSSTAWHCEFEDAPSRVLAHHWPNVPNHRDVTTVDWSTVEPVDILAGGFPCQDLSLAGRRAGMRPGTRSGLWADFRTAIDLLSPSIVVIENVRGLLSGCAESDLESCPGCVGDGEHRPVLRALGRVLGDLADLGFDAEWGGIRAADVGAPHGRYRVFVVAYSERVRRGSGRFARPVEAARGWSSAIGSGRDRTPVELFRTPVADEDGGGPLHPDVAAERGQTLRLTGQILALGGHLLPTPTAADHNGSGGSQESFVTLTDAATGRRGLKHEAATPLHVAWGEYEPAVRRWEALTRPAPAPTKPDGKNGKHRLSSEFVEWMMGLPEGHVTGHGLSRRDELRMLGNGVHVQQGVEAIRQLWARAVSAMSEEVAA